LLLLLDWAKFATIGAPVYSRTLSDDAMDDGDCT
jgi:hypothetical protein